jgi:hypothetical protein
MKYSVLLFCIVLSGCSNDKTGSDSIFREKVLSVTENYIKTKLNASDIVHSDDGVIFIRGGEREYLIESKKIFTGLIDDDKEVDALVTLIPVNSLTEKSKHLVILGNNGDPFLFEIIDSDMKILQLEDRIITAMIPEYPRSSPLFNCHDCREIVRFRLVSGELTKIE